MRRSWSMRAPTSAGSGAGASSTPRASTIRCSAPTKAWCSPTSASPTSCCSRCARAGAHVARPEEVDGAARATCSAAAASTSRCSARCAVEIARQVGLKVPPATKVILTPIDRDRHRRAARRREKLCPVLGFVRVPHVASRHRHRPARWSACPAPAIRPRSTAGTPPPSSPMRAAVKALRVVGQRALQPGRGRLRHASRADLHHRHRLFRPLLGRREYRAAAPGELDADRLQRRGRARHSATSPASTWSAGRLPAWAARRR